MVWKKKDLEKLLFSVDLVVLQNSPWEIERGRMGSYAFVP